MPLSGRKRVVYAKLITGLEVASLTGNKARMTVLSESDEAVVRSDAGELSFGRAFHNFQRRLKYRYGSAVQTAVIHHLQGDRVRHNYHLIEIGQEKLDFKELDSWWNELYASMFNFGTRGRHSLILNPVKAANYLCRYLAGEGFQKATFSHNWVFTGYWPYCRWHYGKYGSHPTNRELAEIVTASCKCERFLEFEHSRQQARMLELRHKMFNDSVCKYQVVWGAGAGLPGIPPAATIGSVAICSGSGDLCVCHRHCKYQTPIPPSVKSFLNERATPVKVRAEHLPLGNLDGQASEVKYQDTEGEWKIFAEVVV